MRTSTPWPPAETLARDLRALGLRDVRTGRDDRMLYATEASP